MRGARLSAVACPATRIASFIVQWEVWGYMFSLVVLVVVYMRVTASSAPGDRGMACARFAPRRSAGSTQGSSSGHWKVNTTLQYDPQRVSSTAVFSGQGWEV